MEIINIRIIKLSLNLFLLTSVFVSASNFTNIEESRSFKLAPPIDLEINGSLVDLSDIQNWEQQYLKEELSKMEDNCFDVSSNEQMESSLFKESIETCFKTKETTWLVENALKIHNKLRKAIDEENEPSHEGNMYSGALKKLYRIFASSLADKMKVIDDPFDPLLKLQGEDGELRSDSFEFSANLDPNKISLPKLKPRESKRGNSNRKNIQYFCPSCGVSIDKSFELNGQTGSRTTVAHNIFSQASWEEGCKKLLQNVLKTLEKNYLDSDTLISKNTKFIMCDPFAQSGEGNTQCQACESLQKNYDLAVRVHWARQALSLDVGELNREAWHDTIIRFVGMQFIAHTNFFISTEEDCSGKNFSQRLDDLVEKLHSEIIDKAQSLIEVKLYKNIIMRLESKSTIQYSRHSSSSENLESNQREKYCATAKKLIDKLKFLLEKENKFFDEKQFADIYRLSMKNIIQKSILDRDKGTSIIKELITEMSFGVFRNRDAVSIKSLTFDTPKHTFKNLEELNSILNDNKKLCEIYSNLNSKKEFRNDFPNKKPVLIIFGSKKKPSPKLRFAKYDEANAEWEFLQLSEPTNMTYDEKEKFISDWAGNNKIAFFEKK